VEGRREFGGERTPLRVVQQPGQEDSLPQLSGSGAPQEHERSRSVGARPYLGRDSVGWSVGTAHHDNRNPSACRVCWHYRRIKRCDGGTGCTSCHAPHPELPNRLRANRGSGSHVSAG
jgi:hypothetical protein